MMPSGMSDNKEIKQLRVRSIREWQQWLEKHHRQETGVWLIFRKKGKGPVPFDYPMALDEALCYGWVDSLLRTLDEKEYMRKFTPRKKSSFWSELNKKKVARLIEEGRMRPAGMELVTAAKESGMWDKKVPIPEVNDDIPGALLQAFKEHRQARDCYFRMTRSHQREYNIWINMAKRAGTIHQRVEESIRLLEKGEQLGLK
jgi:uncharacterized protein YdeI (YjbR/CyaY-like superfamily)